MTTYTYSVQEDNGGWASLTFTVSVKPKKPEGFTATAGTGKATLRWDAIPGVSGWEYQKQEGLLPNPPWKPVLSSTASTTGYIVTGLSANKSYTFKVRALVGTLEGVESDGATITTPQ